MVNAWYRHPQVEMLKPNDHAMTSGAVRHKFKEAAGRSLTSLPPNINFYPRSYCFGCKMPGVRNDLHRYCCLCSVENNRLQCPLNGICRVCVVMNWPDLKARYKGMIAAIRDFTEEDTPVKRYLPRGLATQYDCNVQMLADFKKAGKTADKIPAGETRPSFALEALRPPTSANVPIPDIEQKPAPLNAEPFTSGRYGKRRVTTINKVYASEREVLSRLPATTAPGRRLTLTEVEHYHREYHRPLGQDARIMPDFNKADTLRNYSKDLFCRRQGIKSTERRKRNEDLDELMCQKDVVVSFAVAQRMRIAPNDFVSCVPVDEEHVQMYRRTSSGQVQRDDIIDTTPDWQFRLAEAIPSDTPCPGDGAVSAVAATMSASVHTGDSLTTAVSAVSTSFAGVLAKPVSSAKPSVYGWETVNRACETVQPPVLSIGPIDKTVMSAELEFSATVTGNYARANLSNDSDELVDVEADTMTSHTQLSDVSAEYQRVSTGDWNLARPIAAIGVDTGSVRPVLLVANMAAATSPAEAAPTVEAGCARVPVAGAIPEPVADEMLVR